MMHPSLPLPLEGVFQHGFVEAWLKSTISLGDQERELPCVMGCYLSLPSGKDFPRRGISPDRVGAPLLEVSTMVLKCLQEAALAGLVVPEGADKIEARRILRRREQVEAQLSLVRRAVLMLKSLHTDISALRLDDGDGFQGTGDCEHGHEGVEVTLEWPNLAILVDETKQILDEVAESDVQKIWYVFHGDCESVYRCEAKDREEAMEMCAEENPDSKIHVVIPANCHGELVMYGYGEEMVHCPLCGGRTDFGELPRDWQVHVCLRCNHSFIAVPDDPDEEGSDDGTREKSGDQGEAPQAEAVVSVPRVKTEEEIVAAMGEVIADIAFTAGHLFGTGKIEISDSREMMAAVVEWAHAFEAAFDAGRNGDDYMELVDDYAVFRLKGQHEEAEQLLVRMQQQVAA